MALRRNILLFHQGALGDFILTWPIALALARIHPQSRLFYVTHAQKGKLAEKVLGIESADADVGWHALFSEGGGAALPDAQARMLAGAHSIVSFLPGAQLKELAPDANIVMISPNPPDDWTAHATDFQIEQLRPWPAAQAAAVQILRSIQTRGLSVARAAETKDIVIHPGSGSPKKNWPIDRFMELARWLRDAGQSVRWLVGEVEQEKWDAETTARLAGLAPVARPANYLDLMVELSSARVFVGNDSGPGHLAGILGVPTVALFGPTDPTRWKPLGPKVAALRGESMEEISVDQVVALVNRPHVPEVGD